jgi:hypothetical protein
VWKALIERSGLSASKCSRAPRRRISGSSGERQITSTLTADGTTFEQILQFQAHDADRVEQPAEWTAEVFLK